MTDRRQVLGILQEARELVRVDWGSGNVEVAMEEASGGACASVAIRAVASHDEDAAHAAFLRGAGIEVTENTDLYATVYAFNDAQPNRWPVVAAFDKAIALLEMDEHLEATPNADAALDVMAACDRAGESIAAYVVSQDARQDPAEVAAMASAELFDVAQVVTQGSLLGVTVQR